MTVQHTNDQQFESDVVQAQGPVLVDFWADWCGPCHTIAPILDDLADQYKGHVDIRKVNVDENPEVTQTYGVRALPTLMLFDQGEPVKAFSGVQPRQKLASVLDLYR